MQWTLQGRAGANQIRFQICFGTSCRWAWDESEKKTRNDSRSYRLIPSGPSEVIEITKMDENLWIKIGDLFLKKKLNGIKLNLAVNVVQYLGMGPAMINGKWHLMTICEKLNKTQSEFK